MKKGLIFDIQRYSIHDGPGIRTLVFMKGCPLKCKWCSNPEGINKNKTLLFVERNCIGCGKCAGICPQKAISFSEGKGAIDWDKSKCNECMNCVSICASDARQISGTEYSVDEILDILEKDASFYNRSGGGLTVGGGEPALQSEFVSDLLKRTRTELGVNTAIETSSFAAWEKIKPLYENTDTIFTDIKHMDPKTHRELTGVDNTLILENIKKASNLITDTSQKMTIRTPVIPGLNDSEENILQTAMFVKKLKAGTKLELLKYHNMGEIKYSRTKWTELYPLHGTPLKSEEEMEFLGNIARKAGIEVIVSG